MPFAPKFLSCTTGAGSLSTCGCSLAQRNRRSRTASASSVIATVTLSSTRPVRSDRTLFFTMPEMKVEFGTIDRRAIEGLDLGGAHIDAAHDAFLGADHDPIADTDRPFP